MQGHRVIMVLFACVLVSPLSLSPVQGQTETETEAEAGAEASPPVFFVEENGTAAGPLPLEALAARVAAGTLQRSTRVWTGGQADWVTAGKLDALAGLFAPDDPPGNPDLTIDLPGFFLGSWMQEGIVPLPRGAQGIARITTEYRADQTFSRTGAIDTAATPGSLTLSGEGVWSVTPLGGTGFEVTLAGLMRMKVAGQPAASQLLNQQSRIEVVDRNTLRDPATGELLRRVTP